MDTRKLLLAALLFPVIDIPWLFIQSNYNPFFQKQKVGTSKIWAVIPVYLAMAYLLLLADSPQKAFIIGALTYAVYDFTNYATIADFPLSFGIIDSLWGGTLFALTYFILQKINL
jgi:uncharacterized membrane protein